MCRWAAYLGPDVFLEDIVASPCHSLIAQSHNALEAKSPTNGDGFGIAWYADRSEPGLYRDILPAWSDPNLRSLCRQIRSRLFLAHVRAATAGATSRANCHPFVSGAWSFMHNGQIGGFERVRRALEAGLGDAAYVERQGTTDSELMFLIMLDLGLATDPHAASARMIAKVEAACWNAGVEPAVKFTACFSDGRTLHAIRYASDGQAPTLYAARLAGGGHCLVSEPFDRAAPVWQAIPQSSFVTVESGEVSVSAFQPEMALSAIAA